MNTDKQPQTVYVRCKSEFAHASIFFPLKHDKSILNGMPLPVQEIQNVYIFTTEELKALLQKERREAAEKAWDQSDKTSYEKMAYHCGKNGKYEHPDKEEYLNQHYPLPQPPKQ